VLTPADDDDAAARDGLLRRVDGWSAVVLVVTAAIVFLVGVLPGTFVHWAKDATFLL
jgi:hypothetical protein